MSWVQCPCGQRLSDVAFPAPCKKFMITDEDLDGVTDYVKEKIDLDDFEARRVEVRECFECKRLLVEDKASGLFVSYRREEA